MKPRNLRIFQGREHCPQRLPLSLEIEVQMIEDVFIARVTITPLVDRRSVDRQNVKKYLKEKEYVSSVFRLGITLVNVVHRDVVEGVEIETIREIETISRYVKKPLIVLRRVQ